MPPSLQTIKHVYGTSEGSGQSVSGGSHTHPPSAHSPAQPAPKQAAVTPSGPRGDNPATAGPGKTDVQSPTPENAKGHINPSSPEDANITPGSAGEK